MLFLLGEEKEDELGEDRGLFLLGLLFPIVSDVVEEEAP